MSVPLVLVAASGLAREVLAALAEDPAGFDVRGVLDDAPNLQGTKVGGVPVLGTIDDAVGHPDAMFLVCAGRGASRAAIVDRLASLGIGDDRYATFVHPSASVPATCRIGSGSVLLAGTVLTTDVRLGHHVVCMPSVTLTHDDLVGDFATLCAGVSLGGNVRVEPYAYLGMSSCVRQDLTVGRRATLGMGAVLTKSLPAGQTWAGCPARPLGASRERHPGESPASGLAARFDASDRAEQGS